MQPTYLPWIGYFDLMDQADAFVLLDGVQFAHQSWQHRNRIRTVAGLSWLTIPVVTSGLGGQLINRVEIDGRHRFETKHSGSIRGAYARAPHFRDYFDALAEALVAGAATGRLVDVTIPILRLNAARLGIETPILLSSTLRVDGGRSDRLVAICHALGGDTYLSPAGAAEYLAADAAVFATASITVEIQAYDHPIYPQVRTPFVPHAAAVDLLFNAGPESLRILRSGRRPSVPLQRWSSADLTPSPGS